MRVRGGRLRGVFTRAQGDFDNIFQTAAKIKGSQMEQMRRRFQSWPPYLQNTLFADEEARALRALPIDERLEAAAARRVRGNELFREGNYLGAYNEYQASLGAFIYCRSTDPDWKKKGIKDENLELVNDMGEAEQRDTVKAHVLRCYLNIAAATMHTGEHSICVRACDDALRQDAACVKALYRRARARIAPASAGGLEHEMALEDLKKAAEIDPADAMVTKELTRLRVTLKRQKARDKETFSGMFDRGAVVDEEEEDKLGGGAEARERERAKAQAMAAERQLQQMEAVARQFEAEGKTEQARELRDAIAKAKGSRPEKPQIDFLHPTEKMKKEALERGIDLDDPLVVAELVKLQQSKEFGGAATGTAADSSTAAVGGAGGSDAGAAAAGGRQPYENESALPVPDSLANECVANWRACCCCLPQTGTSMSTSFLGSC